MPKFCGTIGFSTSVEEPEGSGIYKNKFVTKKYLGDILKNTKRAETGEGVNDNVVLSNQISIISDPYARENFSMIAYVTFMGTRWKVTSVEVRYPRLILTLGGVYNGASDQTSKAI